MLRWTERVKLRTGRRVLRAAARLTTGDRREGLTRLADQIDRLLEAA